MAVCLAGAALGGCAVTSDQPLFAVDQAPKHPMREGLWALSGPGCEVKPSPAGQALPECAGVTMTIAGPRLKFEMIATLGGPLAAGKALTTGQPSATDFVLADGDPAIIEMLDGKTLGYDGPAPPTARQVPVSYMALRPLEQDPQGRIVRGVIWPISCPDNPDGAPGFKPSPAPASTACRAETPEAVRTQAPHLKPFTSFFVTWVR